jgi:hypothetical protein
VRARTAPEEDETMTAEQIVARAIDAAGIDEVSTIAAMGPGNMAFSDEEMAALVEAYGSPGDALYAVQLEAQRRVSAMAAEVAS